MPVPIAKPELQRIVLTIISRHIGPENRILRTRLVGMAAHELGRKLESPGKWDYFDRQVRKAIEILHITDEHGAWICSTQEDDGGYFMASNERELNDHLAIEEARATTIFQSVQTRRRLTRMAQPDQMRLDLEVMQEYA